MANWSIYRLSSYPGSHGPLSFLHHSMLHHRFFRTAALLWAAGTANVAAASLRAALAAADTKEDDEKEGSDDDEQHCQPMVNNEFDFFVRVSRGVSSSINRAVVHPVVPPHHLIDHQVCLILDGDPALPVFWSQCRLAASSLLDHRAHCSLTIWTVIRWVLSELKCRLVRCGVILQHRVLAEGLVPPGDQNILEVCRGRVVTTEDH